jgi:methionyl-tRNA synthetase
MRYYITTPIYYVNDAPHIGHAYTSIVADFYARKMRETSEVFFLTGTDEHGQKIEKSAKLKGKSPQQFCDEVSSKFKKMTEDFEISNDDFIRTTEQRHIKGVQEFWHKLEQNGWIYKGKYEGWYAIRDEAFYNEEELINGKAPTGAEVEWQSEESYFFKLSAFTEILLEIYKTESFVFPTSRLNEVKSFVESGLKDLSISRTSFNWGIKVPNDEEHIIYVWLDALINYVTALEGDLLNKFWQGEGKKIHFIGKDILRFHAIFWPAFLIAEKYKIGEINTSEILNFFKKFTIVSHGWWKNEGEKMSKSLGNAINPYDLTAKFGLDKVRYFMLRSLPFGGDGDFSEKQFIEITNADLANNIGNLTQRVMSFIYNNCNGVIPPYSGSYKPKWDTIKEFKTKIENFNFSGAIEEILTLARKCNEIVDKSAPWVLKKEGRIEEMQNILFELAQDIYTIYTMLSPIMPTSALKGIAIFAGKEPKSGNKI